MDGMNGACHATSIPCRSDLLEIFASRELSEAVHVAETSSRKDFSGTGLLMSVQCQVGLARTCFSTPPTPVVQKLNEYRDYHSARGTKRSLPETGCHLDLAVLPKRVRTAEEVVLHDVINVNRTSKCRNRIATCQLLQSRLDSDKKCSLRKERLCFAKKTDFSDTVEGDDLLQRPLNCIIESGELMSSSTLWCPLRLACQVDGASDEFEQSTVKEKLATNDNRMSLDVVQQPLNPARSQTMPFFGQFGGNTYGASSYVNVPRTMLLPVADNMLHMGSAVPRFGTSASSSMFHLTQTAPMPGPGGIFGLPGNAPGFSTASELPTSQHACMPSTYGAQRQTGGGPRWNLLEQQNSSIPQHYPSYSNSFLWRQGMSGHESMDHCFWPSYQTQQQQQQLQQHQLRSNPGVSLSPGRGHASGVGLHHISRPQSAQGSDMCLDMHHSPGTPQSRKTPLGSSPVEKPPSVSRPPGDLLDNPHGSSALQASEHEPRICQTLSSSHHLSYPLISDQLSQGTQSSRELASKLPTSQMSSSKTPQMQMSQELPATVSAASLPLSQMGLDIPAFPLNTAQPRFPSSSSLLVHRYPGFENRFQHPPGIQESSHSIWSQQLRQNFPPTATNFPGNDRAMLTMPGMHQVVRKPFCYPQMSSHRGSVPFPMAQRFPPPAGSGSVVLTDLLQQHSMMQQRSWMPPGPMEVASSRGLHTDSQAMNKVTAASDLPSSIMSSSHLVTPSVKALQTVRVESAKSESCSYDFSHTQGMNTQGSRTPSINTTTDCRPDAEVHLSTPMQKSPSAATKTMLKMETTEQLDVPVNSVVTTVAVRSRELCSVAVVSTVAVTCCVSSSLQSASNTELISSANPAVLSAKNGEVEEERFRSSSRSQLSPGSSAISSAKVPGGSASVGTGNSENMEHTNYNNSSSNQPTSLPRLSGGSDSTLRSSSALSSLHSVSSLVQAPRDLSHQPFLPGFPRSKSDQVFQNRIVSSPPPLQSPNQSVQQDAEAMAMNSQMYQDWLMQRDNSLAEEIKCLELQVAQRRKTKKSLMAKQRTAQKSGRELSEDDIRRLSETGDEQTRLQQQLYQCRKDARSHQSKVQEFRLKTGQGIPDGQQLPIVEGNQERSLDRMQQFACNSQTDQGFPNEVPNLGRHMTSPVEMLHQPLNLNLPQPQGSVPKFPLHPDQPCHQYRVQNRFFLPESSREMQFLPGGQVPDASFRPWLKGESGMRFPCPSGSGMMPPDPAGVAMQNLVNSRQNATGFALLSSNFDRSGAKDSERLKNSCGAYIRTDDGQDRASQQSHFTADTSRRAPEDHTHPRPLLFGSEAQDLNKPPFLEPHKMTEEQGKCMTLAQVRLLSRMTDSMLPKDPNYSSSDGDRPLGHLSGYELKSDSGHTFSLPGQKPVKRGSFSEGDKITRKRMKRPSTDIFSRDETLHPLLPDYETHLTQLFKQLEKLGPLSLTEPDVAMLDTSVPLYKGSEKSLNHDEENASSLMVSQKWKSPSLISPPIQPNNQVSVTVTLSRSVANDIASVVSAIADMLKVATPAKFEIDSESCIQAAGKKKWRTIPNALLYEEQAINLQSLVRARTKFCRHCALPFDSGRVKKEDPFHLEKNDCEEGDRDVAFCSMHCSIESGKACRAATVTGATPSGNHCLKLGIANVNKQDAVSDGRMRTILSQISVKVEKETPDQQRLLQSPSHELKEAKQERLILPEKRTVKARKWENIHYKRWSANLIKNKDRHKNTVLNQPNKSVPQLHEDNFCGIVADSKIPDLRKCAFCLTTGDAATDGPGRLLNMDFDLWVHVNCALWSSEVYETMDGTLMNVAAGYNRGQTLDCVGCTQKGATITCYRNRCTNSYHLECARNDGVTFLENKTCYCRLHYPKCPPAAVLKSMSVCRKVAVDRDENRQVANMLRLDDIESCRMRIGSLVVQNIGQLLPSQIQSGNFNTEDYLYPVGFKSTRYYWNYQQVHSRCRYVCKIIDDNGKPSFVIKVKEPGRDDAIFMDSTCTGVWVKILKALEQLRHSEVLTSFFTDYVHGEDLYGLTEPAIQRVIESLPGVELLSNFKFRFGKSSLYVFPLAINPTGCVRSEPKTKTFLKRSHTLLSSFKVHSSSCGSAMLGSGEFNIQQYMKQFTHTKPQRYRSLKTEWRNNVYLRRSNIQGLGLFAARQLEQYTMVIEYIGQLIRNELCESREKIYEQQNRGIYMFRIDENTVIDATMAGGPARYINHSCDPNCFTEIIPTERGNKIVITALQKINSGEELTYDYKFDLEDDKKIPCLCGAAKCQKWMN